MMATYCSSVKEAYDLSNAHQLAPKLWQLEHDNNQIDTKNAEYRSWENSLPLLLQDIMNAGLGELTIIFEYETPMSDRIDAILVGYDQNGKNQILIIENKQWNHILADDSPETVLISRNDESRHHPCAQLVTYIKDLQYNHSAISELRQRREITINGVAFCHNMADPTQLLQGEYQLWNIRGITIFGQNHAASFPTFLQKMFSNRPNEKLAEQIINGQYTLNPLSFKGLQQVFNRQENAVMLGRQSSINMQIAQLIKEALNGSRRRKLVIISGDPGTGKTVVGLHLIYDYLKYGGDRRKAAYALPRSKALANIIGYESGLRPVFIGNTPDNCQLVVLDEAHRITDVKRELDTLFVEKGAQLVVLLQDDLQRIRPNESGTVINFVNYAKTHHLDCLQYQLKTQMRSGLQSNLVNSLDDLFQNRPQSLVSRMPITVDDSLASMVNWLKQQQQTTPKVKLIAPYCWKWGNKLQDSDIQIVDGNYRFQANWNPGPNQDKKQGQWYAGQSNDSLDQVASIYTCQGVEWDYTGLIWWDDLIWDPATNSWRNNLKASADSAFKSALYQARNVDPLVLFENTYRVLLSRAMKGMHIWFKDPVTEQHVREYLHI